MGCFGVAMQAWELLPRAKPAGIQGASLSQGLGESAWPRRPAAVWQTLLVVVSCLHCHSDHMWDLLSPESTCCVPLRHQMQLVLSSTQGRKT